LNRRLSQSPLFCVIAAALVALLGLRAARAQQITVVLSSDAAPYTQAQAGLTEELAVRKIQPRTILLQTVAANPADLPAASTVVAIGTPAAVWLHKNLPRSSRLIYCMVSDPAAAGLADARAAHGVTTDVSLKQQFGLIAEALPNTHTVGILYRANSPESNALIRRTLNALPDHWQLVSVAVDQRPSIAAAIDDLTRRQVDIIWTTPDPAIYDTATVRTLLLASLRTNIPVFGFSTAFVRAGAILGVGVDASAQGRRAADLTLQLLSTPDAANLPQITAADHFPIAVNLVVAERLGIQLPQDLVGRATDTFHADK
jgi:putative tryptophan/tyrosine transport system substrate-binding protein